MILRTVDRREERRNTPNITCHEEDCDKTTRDGKDYCSDHVKKNTYVAILLEQLKKREKEETRVIKKGETSCVKPDSSSVQDILNYLKDRGESTLPRIAMDLSLRPDAVVVYIRYCVNKRFVLARKNKRGVDTAILKPKEPRKKKRKRTSRSKTKTRASSLT